MGTRHSSPSETHYAFRLITLAISHISTQLKAWRRRNGLALTFHFLNKNYITLIYNNGWVAEWFVRMFLQLRSVYHHLLPSLRDGREERRGRRQELLSLGLPRYSRTHWNLHTCRRARPYSRTERNWRKCCMQGRWPWWFFCVSPFNPCCFSHK